MGQRLTRERQRLGVLRGTTTSTATSAATRQLVAIWRGKRGKEKTSTFVMETIRYKEMIPPPGVNGEHTRENM